MYLWVDDIRTPPCNDWLWARSTNEAITAIKSYERSFATDTIYISLDHDAGRTLYERQRDWKKFDKDKYTKAEALSEMKRRHPDCECSIKRGNEPNSLFDYWEVCADNRLFDEVYEGPVMISPKLVLSHEPIDCAGWAFNLHGHIHARSHKNDECHYNVCADCHNYLPLNLNRFLKSGALSKISSIHRQTIDEATARCKKRGYRLTTPKNK